MNAGSAYGFIIISTQDKPMCCYINLLNNLANTEGCTRIWKAAELEGENLNNGLLKIRFVHRREKSKKRQAPEFECPFSP